MRFFQGLCIWRMRALELDPDLPEAHHSLGGVKHFLQWDWTGADACYTRALELDPRLAVTRGWRATLYLVSMMRRQDALTESVHAMKLEPDSGLIAYLAAINHYWARDIDGAAELIERALELEPQAVFPHWLRALIFSVKGHHDEAISATMRAVKSHITTHFWFPLLGRHTLALEREPKRKN